jgi:hypothetical protein
MKLVDRWVTGLTAVGIFMWVVFNGKDVNIFIGGLAKNAVGYLTGIANVSKGQTPQYYTG